MNIIGLEILKSSNPGVAVAPPGKLEIAYGQTLRITTGFGYRGAVGRARLYGAIGHSGVWFTEKLSGEQEISLPDSRTQFTPCSRSVDILVTSDIAPGTGYDLYCKIREYPEAGLPEVDDVIDITGIPPTYELLEETIYPYAYIYEGDVEVSTFTFKSNPFTPANWIAGGLVDYLENEVRKAGGRVMEMRVYVDKSPLLWTDWRIEVVGTPPAGIASIGIAWWGVAILAALAIIAIIAITWSIKTIAGVFKRKPGLEDVKPGWKKETLILTIQDSEEYWKRTPTSIETLKEMSEPELRDYLDEMAEEEMPKGIGWGTIAIIGALGLGALALASALKRKE